MSDDIVKRLREKRGVLDNRWPGPTQMDLEAADEIERLRKFLKRFEPALNCTSCDPCIYPECRRGYGK